TVAHAGLSAPKVPDRQEIRSTPCVDALPQRRLNSMIPRTEVAQALRLMSQMTLDPPGNVRILLNPHGYSKEVEVAAMDFPSPPVPAKLREMLKDYPEHIEQLQKALISVSHGRQSYAPPFEGAVWLLEDCLTSFVAEARAELATAEASGNPKAIAQSQKK
ncbi:hypothetical protein O0J72_17205, partial [Stenotrophomonas sp. Sm3212]